MFDKCSKDLAGDHCCDLIAIDTNHFSRISMLRSRIGAGLMARVPEPILFLQSGHGANCAASINIVPRELLAPFETYDAFGLYGQGQQTG